MAPVTHETGTPTRMPHPEADRLARLDRAARLLDARFRVPGTGVRFGYDSLLGLIPGIGDAVTTLPALWIFSEAAAAGVRKRALAKMAVNIGLDSIIGAIPLAGDLFDVAWKANLRNIAILRDELERRPPPRG